MKRFLILFTLLYSNICFSFTEFSIFKKKFNIAESEVFKKSDKDYMQKKEERKKGFYVSNSVGKLHSSNINKILTNVKPIVGIFNFSKGDIYGIKYLPKNFDELNIYLKNTEINDHKIKKVLEACIENINELLWIKDFDVNNTLKELIAAFQRDELEDATNKIIEYIKTTPFKRYTQNLEKLFQFIHDEEEEKLIQLTKIYYSKTRDGLVFLTNIPNNIQNGEIDLRWLSSLSLGYYIGDNYKVELKAFSSKMNLNIPFNEKIHTLLSASIYGLIPTLYYTYNIKNTPFNLYSGMGLGPAICEITMNIGTQSLTSSIPFLTSQARIGIDYSLNQRTKISLGYRLFYMPMASILGVHTHNIETGLTFNF
ncbi:porin family protein [Wolbachia endosymbiont of Chironomus riparius]|uniref:porin family protein n=1 Tax=Wolbachia endosymbiont of Chironomus riparius TaxID=2883238 RepID=UPI00209DC165|nr:porin family protein [Wolbachia endosymbiont of Chironomus riparius]